MYSDITAHQALGAFAIQYPVATGCMQSQGERGGGKGRAAVKLMTKAKQQQQHQRPRLVVGAWRVQVLNIKILPSLACRPPAQCLLLRKAHRPPELEKQNAWKPGRHDHRTKYIDRCPLKGQGLHFSWRREGNGERYVMQQRLAMLIEDGGCLRGGGGGGGVWTWPMVRAGPG